MAVSLLPVAKPQENNNSKPEEAATSAIAKKVINLWPGVAPGSEQWKQPEANLGSGGMETTVNVSTPTLTAYLPAPSTATGTAVIIALGGGFIGLSINSEAHDVAKWLVARGFVAIVLKYRTKQVEGKDAAQLGESTRAAFMAQLNDHALIAEDGKYGIADGIQAVKVVRAHAAEWGISPDRIVFTGFSAGGMITEMTAVQPDARPNYAAPIYESPPSGYPSKKSILPSAIQRMNPHSCLLTIALASNCAFEGEHAGTSLGTTIFVKMPYPLNSRTSRRLLCNWKRKHSSELGTPLRMASITACSRGVK
jgi:dienelactone hydrolase